MTTLKLWHGSNRWEGPPQIQTCEKGKHEHGPGIYCTTNLDTAHKFMKRAGRVVEFEVDANIGWLETEKLPFESVMRFVKESSNIKKKRVLMDDLNSYYNRDGMNRSDGLIRAVVLVNLAIKNESMTGEGGQEVARFLVANGIHASLAKESEEDNWVLLFDPEKIESVRVLSSKDLDWKNPVLPSIKEQLEHIQNSRAFGR